MPSHGLDGQSDSKRLATVAALSWNCVNLNFPCGRSWPKHLDMNTHWYSMLHHLLSIHALGRSCQLIQAAWEMAITAMDATAQPTPMPRCVSVDDDNRDRNGWREKNLMTRVLTKIWKNLSIYRVIVRFVYVALRILLLLGIAVVVLHLRLWSTLLTSSSLSFGSVAILEETTMFFWHFPSASCFSS